LLTGFAVLGSGLATRAKYTGDPTYHPGGSGLMDRVTYGNVPTAVEEAEIGGEKFIIPLNHKNGKRGIGIIAREDHLVTVADNMTEKEDQPEIRKNVRYKIKEHLANTSFEANCPSSAEACEISTQLWEESGQGSKMGFGKIPTDAEPWIMNLRWSTDGSDINHKSSKTTNPPEGTRIIITAPSTGRSIVALAGYEWGPGKSSPYYIGASPEVMGNLNISTGAKVSVGIAKDQSLVAGTVYMKGSGGTYRTIYGENIAGEYYPPLGEYMNKVVSINRTKHKLSGKEGHLAFATSGFSGKFKNFFDPAIDYNVKNGSQTPVYATFDGVITGIKKVHHSRGYGKGAGVIWMESTDGKDGAIYAHITFLDGIKKGTKVNKGQQLGTIALHCSSSKNKSSQCVEFSGAEHLHFQLYIDNKSLTKNKLISLFPYE